MENDLARPRRSPFYRALKWSAGLLAVGFIACYGYYRYTYPYGWSHCCSLALAGGLENYAEEHGGKYPAGQASPEASLSLLLKDEYGVDANILRGKTVPLETVERALKKDGVLGPESCGWHYVEGLTEADDPNLAIVWDKVGLGHNGERHKGGVHEVIQVGGSRTFVRGADWEEFLDKQQQLMAKRTPREREGSPLLTGSIQMPDGTVTNEYDGAYTLKEKVDEPNMRGDGVSTGSRFSLVKYHLYQDSGTIAYTLTLPDLKLRSKEIDVLLTNGLPSTNHITFVMEKF